MQAFPMARGVVLALGLAMSACAKSPDSIAPAYVCEIGYL